MTHCNRDMANIPHNSQVESPLQARVNINPDHGPFLYHILQKSVLLMLVTPLVWHVLTGFAVRPHFCEHTVLSAEVKGHMHQHLEYSTAASASIAHSVELQARRSPRMRLTSLSGYFVAIVC